MSFSVQLKHQRMRHAVVRWHTVVKSTSWKSRTCGHIRKVSPRGAVQITETQLVILCHKWNRQKVFFFPGCSVSNQDYVLHDPSSKCHEWLPYWVKKLMSTQPLWLISSSAAQQVKRISAVIVLWSWVRLPSCRLGPASNLTLTFLDL